MVVLRNVRVIVKIGVHRKRAIRVAWGCIATAARVIPSPKVEAGRKERREKNGIRNNQIRQTEMLQTKTRRCGGASNVAQVYHGPQDAS